MSNTAFYDRVLAEIEAGHFISGVTLLAGMFEGSLLCGKSIDRARSEFRRHPLYRLLVQGSGGSTGLQLRSAISTLTVTRARAARVRMMHDYQARRTPDEGQVWRIEGACLSGGARRFELICAPDLADHVPGAGLPALVAELAGHLTEAGQLLLAPFLPNHLGWGWQCIFPDQAVHCHAEAELRAAAGAAGLHLTACQDATGSFLCCVLWPVVPGSTGGQRG